jgi:DNA-directed RNA polymerase specialized sigma24 family protein
MNKDWELTKEQFDRLLDWLDADREIAGRKYGLIQLRLVRFFASRGCTDSENLADQTINIVASKVEKLIDYQGEQALYFHGVAKYVYLQEVRERQRLPPPPPPPSPPPPDSDPDPDPDVVDTCLERCLEELTADERQLVLRYEEGEKQTRIRERKRIARELGVTINALRIKICRLHLELRKCMEQCLAEIPAH